MVQIQIFTLYVLFKPAVTKPLNGHDIPESKMNACNAHKVKLSLLHLM